MKHLLTLALPALLAAGPASAFEPAEDRLFVGWPELAAEYVPGREAQVYAIVTENGEAVYVIAYNVQGRLQPLGAFACSDSFEVLDSVANGFHDIACVNHGRRALLRADESGAYRYAN